MQATHLSESTKSDLANLFNPRSVAIVGASSKPGSVGNDLVKNLLSFGGEVYLVNIKEEVIEGKQSVGSISKIDQPIDLVIIAVPAQFVAGVLKEAAQKGVKSAVVISAGFKEAGHKDLEDEMIAICRENNIALIGPNCLGFINPELNLNASFAGAMPQAGPVAFISQSGALCAAVVDYAKYYSIGFSKFVSIGNKAVLDEVELLQYLFEDEKTKVIAMYLESLTRSRELIQFMQKMHCSGHSKPVIIIKSGRTSAGASASVSHTGALAGADSAYDALFRQAGILRAATVEEMFDLVRVFVDNEALPTNGVAVITNAGGPGVLATDSLISGGLEMAKLSDQTIEKLKNCLPEAANVHNPIDVLGDAKADRYSQALQAAVEDENVQSAVVLLTPQSMTEIVETAHAIAAVEKTTKKPIVVSFMGEETVDAGVKVLQKEGVAAVNFPEQAARALCAMNKFSTSCANLEVNKFTFNDTDKAAVAEIFKSAGKKVFPESEALSILKHYGFPLLQSQVAKSAAEASEAATKIGTPVAMKIVSQDILHKSDVGGVSLNIDPKNAAQAYEEMMTRVSQNKPDAKLDGVLIMEMAPKNGFEFILGASKDPALGQMAMVGVGGILVEVLKDVSFGLVPINKNDARAMLNEIKAKKIFDGVRGMPPLDTEAMIDSLGRLSQFLSDFPQIKELDINPLYVLEKGQGARVLDARIVLE